MGGASSSQNPVEMSIASPRGLKHPTSPEAMTPFAWKRIRAGAWSLLDPGSGGRPPAATPKRSGDVPEISFEAKWTHHDDGDASAIFEVYAMDCNDVGIMEAELEMDETWLWEEPTVILGDGRFDADELLKARAEEIKELG